MVLLLAIANAMRPNIKVNDNYLDVEDDSIVQTENGQIQGSITQYGRAFLGIPYAAPPVGQNRWNNPQPVTSWSGIRNTTEWSAGCPQNCVLPPNSCPPVQSEDCLYLNVYTPNVDSLNTPQPVMFYLHGGRYEQGAAGSILYDGGFMANRSGVVIVTANYRLGALGWLTLQSEITGNYAIQDQRQAMLWVQNNIKYFGGNPNQITIFGQSAGSSSIMAHIISPKSKGLNLFQQAIVESVPSTLPNRPMEDAIAIGQLFSQDAGCPNYDATCLRNLDVSAVIQAQDISQKHLNILKPIEEFYPWTPTVDGIEITGQLLDVLSSGPSNYMNVPLILGTVSEEVYMFIFLADKSPMSDADYLAAMAAVFLTASPEVVAMYPPTPLIGDKRPALGVAGSDYVFYGSNRAALVQLLQTNLPIYNYQFSHAMSDDIWGPNYTFCVGHVCHGSEIPFVWHIDRFNFTAEEEVLSLSMIDYWTNFARSGNPNSPAPVDVNWPLWDNTTLLALNFTVPENFVASDVRGEYLNFWDKLGYGWGW